MDRSAQEKDLYSVLLFLVVGSRPFIGISLGDVTGIGPEVTLKAIAGEAGRDAHRYLLIGDADLIKGLNEKLGLAIPWSDFSEKDAGGRFLICNPLNDPLPRDLRRPCAHQRRALALGQPGRVRAGRAGPDWKPAG